VTTQPPPPIQAQAATPAASGVVMRAGLCSGQRVYLQVFGDQQKDEVRAYRDDWRRLGASVPPIEDVIQSARRAGRTPPRSYASTTVLYHDEKSRPCAEQLPKALQLPAGQSWDVKELPKGLKKTPGVIEVWVARPLVPTRP
jgi:hypothetical protein